MKIGTFFSGIGAPEFAIKSLSIPYTIEFACDNDPFVKETYMANHNCKNFYDDITTIKEIPNVDLLVFGFPCQPFSFAGNRNGLKDKRGTLVLNALDLMRKNKPKMFIAENVEGLLDIEDGRVLAELVKSMKRLGYNIKYEVLNSLDFGIPHSRRRLWIVGTQHKFNFPQERIASPRLSEFLDKSVDENVFATKAFLAKPKVVQRLRNYKNPYINCITQTICRNGSSSEYISYVAAVNNAIGQARKPTVRECCRLFGLPDKFSFPEIISNTRRYGMLANSMVVPVLESLIERMI